MPRRSIPISEARFDAKLRAILNASGGTVLGDTESMAGFITLESDRPEWGFPGGERLCGAAFFAAGAAGTFPLAICFNPEDSGVLTVVEKVRWTTNGVLNTVLVRFFDGTLATLLAAGFVENLTAPLDTRDRFVISPGILGATTTKVLDDDAAAVPAGSGGVFDDLFIAANTDVVLTHPYILRAGTGLLLHVGSVGLTNMNGSFRWRERAVQSPRGT